MVQVVTDIKSQLDGASVFTFNEAHCLSEELLVWDCGTEFCICSSVDGKII